MTRAIFIFLISITLSACFGGVEIKPTSIATSPEPPIEHKAAPIMFGRLSKTLPRGTEIGGYVWGLMCAGPYVPVTVAGRRFIDNSDFDDKFIEVMRDAGYDVAGDPDAAVTPEDVNEDLARAEYMVHAKIKDIKMNLCRETDFFMRQIGISGEASINVEWTIYSSLDRKAVAKITTDGYWKAHEAKSDGDDIALQEAFAAAAANLAANEKFRDIVFNAPDKSLMEAVDEREADDKTVSNGKISFRPADPAHAPSKPADAIASTVIVATSLAHGSGFFVADKLLITNAHVVSNAETVRIEFVNGKHVQGKVLKANARRDVALIQITDKKLPLKIRPLAVRLKPLEISEEVYAIGAPLFEKLSGTLTRGIVSAFRNDKIEGPLIQADVTTHPGNSGGPLIDSKAQVVGLTVAGYERGGSAGNLNLFIPITDALDKLGML